MTYAKQIALTVAAVTLLAAIPIGIQSQRLTQTKAELEQAQAAIWAAPSQPPSLKSATETF